MAACDIQAPVPEAYGAFHLLFMCIGFPVVIILAWKVRNLGETGSRRLLFCCGLIMLFGEAFKQCFYYFYVGGGVYIWKMFPFHMCSVPMYFLVIVPFLKDGPIKSGMCHFMMIYNLLGGCSAYLEPSGMIQPEFIMTVYSFLWHLMLIFVAFYLGFSNLCAKRMRDFFYATVTLLVLCLMAFCINLLFWDASGGKLNMFFVGPAITPLIVFHDIAKAAGWYTATAAYLVLILLGGVVIFLPFYLSARKKA